MYAKKNIVVSAETHKALCEATLCKETFDQTISRLIRVYMNAGDCEDLDQV